MSRMVASGMERAAQALKTADLALAEQVIDDDRRIDEIERSLDDQCIQLLLLQAPVATDLRVVVSALRLTASLERMGDLARHVAFVARGRYPEHALSGEMREIIERMADAATKASQRVVELLDNHELELASVIAAQDDVLDDLHRRTFAVILDDTREMTRQQLVDSVLLGRYLERFGDHAVSVADRVTYLVTGQLDHAAADVPPSTERE